MRTCVFALIFLYHGMTFSKTVTFATFPIPLMVESEEKGLFVNLTREIARRNKLDVKINILPKARTILQFSKKEVHGFFPVNQDSLIKSAVKTIPFYIKVDYLFYRKDNPIRNIKDLEGKKVGLTFRYSYWKDLISNKNIQFEYASDEIQNMKKLGLGQLQAFIAEERSGLRALHLSGQKDIIFNKNAPLFSQDIFYAFQENEEGRGLAAIFSKTIDAMKLDGSLQKILQLP